ncbi:MAG: hypothetical protein MJ016_06675 [Victivallaceae bacterium]|nr:hypothetical protein [Victivallaceae bacterium]
MRKKIICAVLTAAMLPLCRGEEIRVLRNDSGEKVGTVCIAPGTVVVRDGSGNLLWSKNDESSEKPKPEVPTRSPGAIEQILMLPVMLVGAVVLGVCAIIDSISKANL